MVNKKDGMTIEDLAGIVKGVAKTTEKSIEDLAGMIQRNFPTKNEMNLKFDEVKDEIREVRNGLDDVKIELEEVHDIVRRIDEKDLPNLKRRVTTLETNIKPLIK